MKSLLSCILIGIAFAGECISISSLGLFHSLQHAGLTRRTPINAVEMTLRYAHLSQTDLTEAVERRSAMPTDTNIAGLRLKRHRATHTCGHLMHFRPAGI
jgi:hypothetical protein